MRLRFSLIVMFVWFFYGKDEGKKNFGVILEVSDSEIYLKN